MQKKEINSEELGIDLKSQKEPALFKWFLACLLFGKPIQQQVAQKTYFEFEKAGLVTPDAILGVGWQGLVDVLGQGHYVRYDESTATKLLEVMEELKEQYGSVSQLVKNSQGKQDLVSKLTEFKGVGLKTAEIFMRDLESYEVI